MSRHGYVEDYGGDSWELVLWRGGVQRALNGRRGQALLQEMADVMDAMPDHERQLSRGDFVDDSGMVCALGTVGQKRGLDMTGLDPEDSDTTAKVFGIAPGMAREIMYINDGMGDDGETPESRFDRVREWLHWNIKRTHELVTPDRDF